MPRLDLRIVCATRLSGEAFHRESALGRSLAAGGYLDLPFIKLALIADNTTGLPVVYNRVIEAAVADPAVLVFVHDDVHLVDYYWPDRLYGALTEFQLVGVCGNRVRHPRQPSWCFKDEWFTWDSFDNLSGFMGYGETLPYRVTRFGRVGGECKLLDGVFLAAESPLLIAHGLRFDEAFDFHFYDMDLCRQAEAKGLRMGTTAICVIHESIGKLRSSAWSEAFQRYLAKWGD